MHLKFEQPLSDNLQTRKPCKSECVCVFINTWYYHSSQTLKILNYLIAEKFSLIKVEHLLILERQNSDHSHG